MEYLLSTTQWLDAFHGSIATHLYRITHVATRLLDNVVVANAQHLQKDDDPLVAHLLSSAKRSLQDRTRLERISFGLSLDYEEHGATDLIHKYHSLKRIDVIDTKNGIYTSHRWLEVENVSNTDSEFIVHMEAGENKISFCELKLRAWYGSRSGQILSVDSLVNRQPSFVQVARIRFPKPIQPNERARVYYRISWPGEPGAYGGREHSQSIALSRYRMGVSRLDFGVLEMSPISHFRCEKVTDYFTEQPCDTECEDFFAEDDQELEPIHGKGYKGFRYALSPEVNSAYRFFYYLTIEKQEDDDDEF
jgi:hypothetical protein